MSGHDMDTNLKYVVTLTPYRVDCLPSYVEAPDGERELAAGAWDDVVAAWNDVLGAYLSTHYPPERCNAIGAAARDGRVVAVLSHGRKGALRIERRPHRHELNGPDTWQVVKAGDRSWHLVDADGAVLDYFPRKKDAEQAKTSGFMFEHWHKQRRWFRGEAVAKWKPYAPAVVARFVPAVGEPVEWDASLDLQATPDDYRRRMLADLYDYGRALDDAGHLLAGENTPAAVRGEAGTVTVRYRES